VEGLTRFLAPVLGNLTLSICLYIPTHEDGCDVDRCINVHINIICQILDIPLTLPLVVM